MKEIIKQFKDTPLFVSNLGYIFCKEYIDKKGHIRKEHIINGSTIKTGHLRFKSPFVKGTQLMHVFIYECFNGVFNHQTHCVHHINHNPIDNRLENLQLLEVSEHIKLHRIGDFNNPLKSKKVFQYDKDLNLLKIWDSTKECGRNDFDSTSISKCCNGKLKTYKGFIWSYRDLSTIT